jgi:hypothetical protein
VEAWRLTEGLKYCNNNAVYPTAEMRWGMASTAGARDWIHIDSDGLGTYVDVQCGGKWVLIFTPSDMYDVTSFADIKQFMKFNPSALDDRWMVEAVYLKAGSRL